MDPKKDPAEFGKETAIQTAKIMGSVHRGTVFREPPPCQGLVPQERNLAVKAYVSELFDISKKGQPSRTESDMRILLIQQMDKMLVYPSLKRLVDSHEINRLVESYVQVWADGGIQEGPYARKINSIFQETQSNYASSKGIIRAIYGFRMVGQAKVGVINPFFLADMDGVDSIAMRLSFLLRHADNKGVKVQTVITGGSTGADLSVCWGQCVDICFGGLAGKAHPKEDKNLKAIYKAGDALAELHPQHMTSEVKSWDQDFLSLFIHQGKEREEGRKITALVKNAHLLKLAGKEEPSRASQAYNRKM